MRKIVKLFASAIFLVIICLSQPATAQLSDAERLERCQNNKTRLAELEIQLQVINADLSASMTKKEMQDARTNLAYVKSVRLNKIMFDRTKFERVSAIYNVTYEECFYEVRQGTDHPTDECTTKLEKIIAAKIDKAVPLDRTALLAKKKKIDQQIAAHRNNIIALDCDHKATGACTLAASWTQDTPGIGSTTWDIKSDGTATETGIGYATGKATLNGNKLHIDWKTGTGYSGYYEWTLDENCSGKGTLVFKTGRTDSLNSTVKRN